MSIEKALKDAGLFGLPFAWGADGSISFGDGLTQEQKDAITVAVTEGIAETVTVYSCTPWQIRKALNAQSMRQAVEDAIAASNDQSLKDGWQFATEFRSDDPFVLAMGATLGLSALQTAQMIQAASSL